MQEFMENGLQKIKEDVRIGLMFRNWLRNNFKFADFQEFRQTDTLVFSRGR